MGTKRTFAFALFLLPGMAAAGSDPLLSTFAICTGRLSALMEHQWLVSSPEADATRARRDGMEALLAAITPPETAPQVLARRIEAKYAMSRLLTRVTFNRDRTDAARAARHVEVQIASCNALLLG